MAARRKKAPVQPGKQCSRTLENGKRCPEQGSTYVTSGWFCDAHIPAGDPSCTHSLGSERCAYCGGRIGEPNGGIDPEFGIALTINDIEGEVPQ